MVFASKFLKGSSARFSELQAHEKADLVKVVNFLLDTSEYGPFKLHPSFQAHLIRIFIMNYSFSVNSPASSSAVQAQALQLWRAFQTSAELSSRDSAELGAYSVQVASLQGLSALHVAARRGSTTVASAAGFRYDSAVSRLQHDEICLFVRPGNN